MDFLIIHRTAFWLGLALIVIAVVMSANRTGNWSGIVKFWQKQMEMNPTEFKLHRSGLVLMIAGVALSLLDQVL